jgi:hypothetical protein
VKILLTITTVVLLALASVANANTIQIQYKVGVAGAVTTCTATAPGPVDCADVTGPPLTITELDANSNNPGTPNIAVTTSSDLDLLNNSTSSQTIYIEISVNGFTAPVGSNATLLSHIGGTVLIGGTADLLSFESCVDPSNALTAVGASVTCPATAVASGISGPSVTAVGSFQNDKSATLASLSAPYSIDESMAVTLAAGAHINWSASTTVTASTVPEPASAMLFLGAGLIGLGAFGRNRFFRK